MGSAQIIIPPGKRLGDLVVEANDLRKGFGNQLLIDDLRFKLPPGGIVGVIGPNGAGKTTLFNIIAGFYSADFGEIIFEGENISSLRSDELFKWANYLAANVTVFISPRCYDRVQTFYF